MMFGARHRTSAIVAGLVVIGALGALLVTVTGCRDEEDPNYWLGKMDDVVWRDQALTNLERLFSAKMREVNNDRDDPGMQDFVKTVGGGLITSYQSLGQASTQDVTSMNKIVQLLSQMETTAALPVYQSALSDVSGTKIGRANTAAEAVARFCRSSEDQAEFIPPATKRTEQWTARCSAAEGMTETLLSAIDQVTAQRTDRGENAENTPEEDSLVQSLVSAIGNILLGNPQTSHRQAILDKLIQTLETPDTAQDLRINMAALKMLGEIGDNHAIPVLVRALFMQGRRRAVALQEVARTSIMQVTDLGAMADAMVKAGRMQDEGLNAMQKADPNFDVRLIKEQVAITLGMMQVKTQPVVGYLMEELNHNEMDDFDRIPGRGKATWTPERSKGYRRMFAAGALAKLHHEPALGAIITRLEVSKQGDTYSPVDESVMIEEWPGYLDSAGDFLLPGRTNKVIIPFSIFGDDALLDRSARRLALQAGADQAPALAKRGTKMEDCPEEIRARGCVKDNFLKRYVPMLKAGEGCTSVECWTGKLSDDNAYIRERAAYQLAMLGYGNDSQQVALDALIAALDERSAEVLGAYIFAIDRLSPNGCNEQCLTSIQTRIDDMRGRSTMNAPRRALIALRARLAYRARSGG